MIIIQEQSVEKTFSYWDPIKKLNKIKEIESCYFQF